MNKKISLLCLLLILIPFVNSAQDSTSATPPVDEGMDLFLLIIAGIFISLMLGAAVAGSVAVTGLILALGIFISMGIVSVAAMTALYKRSLSAGFKTFLFIVCPLAGILLGIGGVWITGLLFHHPLNMQEGFIIGSVAGLAGGLLMAVAVSKITIRLSHWIATRIRKSQPLQ
jgi:hypothetical protein